MIKVCFFTGDINGRGGTERVTIDIANLLVNNYDDYEVHIVSLGNKSNTSFFEIDKNIKLFKFYDSSLNNRFKIFHTVRNLRKYILENKIDILIDVDTILSVYSVLATRFTKVKIISWEHFNFYENLGCKFRSIGRYIAAKKATHVLTITKADKINFEKNLKIKGGISNIYNPIKELKGVNKYKEDSKIIISAGRLTYQKGFDMLIDIAEKVFLDSCTKEWKWFILGDGEDREMLESKIKEKGLEKKIFLQGNVSNIEEYYKEAAIFVLTSRYEGLGMVLLEAINNKIPSISFDCNVGPNEIISHGENGFLISSGDIDNMSLQIKKIIKDDSLRKEISDKCSGSISKFSVDEIGEQWNQLLKNIYNLK